MIVVRGKKVLKALTYIHLAEDRYLWRVPLNKVMNTVCFRKCAEYLGWLSNYCFRKRVLLCGFINPSTKLL
jgi:hypothetical protein